jgi:hypothetical protein
MVTTPAPTRASAVPDLTEPYSPSKWLGPYGPTGSASRFTPL